MARPDSRDLSIARQCDLLKLSRSAFYYKPVRDRRGHAVGDGGDRSGLHPVSVLRQPPDPCHPASGRYGRRSTSGSTADAPDGTGSDLQATSDDPAHPVYPYLLKGMIIDRPNQVWCTDITFIPVRRGFLYLVAVMDWTTRKVLSWRLSNTMHASFCIEALDEAIATHGAPEIMNTDQGSQFTGADWITTLTEADIRVSMDGRGRCMDNIFIERFWRSLQQEAVYLTELMDGFHARKVIQEWIDFYNTRRPHSALEHRTPAEAYWAGRTETLAA